MCVMVNKWKSLKVETKALYDRLDAAPTTDLDDLNGP